MKINAIIEIHKNSFYKYEHDKSGRLVLDRALSVAIPHNYGYIPNTLCEDGDALDVFVVSNESITPDSIVEIEVDSILICEDNGVRDDKVIATIKNDPLCYKPSHHDYQVITRYLSTYKKGLNILTHEGKEKALQLIKSVKKGKRVVSVKKSLT